MQLRVWASFKAVLGAAFPLDLDTHICTHTQTPALKLHGIVSKLETHPAFDLNSPTLQEAGILTPSGLLVKQAPGKLLPKDAW